VNCTLTVGLAAPVARCRVISTADVDEVHRQSAADADADAGAVEDRSDGCCDVACDVRDVDAG